MIYVDNEEPINDPHRIPRIFLKLKVFSMIRTRNYCILHNIYLRLAVNVTHPSLQIKQSIVLSTSMKLNFKCLIVIAQKIKLDVELENENATNIQSFPFTVVVC